MTGPGSPSRAQSALRPSRLSRRPTILQVAKASGVARSTVSAILTQRDDCFASSATRQRVWDAVQSLGYRPNLAARALVSGKTWTLGVITTGVDVEVTRDQWLAFETAAREVGYLTMISFNPNDPAIEDRLLLTMRDRCADGVLLFPSETGDHKELAAMVRRCEPVVTIDGKGRLPFATDDVTVDHYAGGQLQGRHLLEIGRRRVCIANYLHTCCVVDRRVEGLTDVLTEAGFPPVRMNLPFDAWPVGTDDEADYMRRYLREHRERFDAIAAVGDSIALWTMGLALSVGIRVPHQMAFIGYDGLSFAANTMMPLSTIANPTMEVGRAAFDLLMRRIQSPGEPQQQMLIPPRLVVRTSTVSCVSGSERSVS